ncbi:MAG: hypothetical protein [Podoviridae sp. ctcf755]|nr:MAG: hypothetical protein [Podoviridae sp. ctcf755]
MRLKDLIICFQEGTFFNIYNEYGLTEFRGYCCLYGDHKPDEKCLQKDICKCNVIVEDDGEPVVQIHLMPEVRYRAVELPPEFQKMLLEREEKNKKKLNKILHNEFERFGFTRQHNSEQLIDSLTESIYQSLKNDRKLLNEVRYGYTCYIPNILFECEPKKGETK